MSRWLSVHEAATALGISAITLKRRIKAGSVEAKQEKTPTGFKWLVAVPDEVSAPPQSNVEHRLNQIIELLQDELAARRREVAELHVLLQQEQQQRRALEAPRDTVSADTSRDTSRRYPWWQFWRTRADDTAGRGESASASS